MILGRKLDGFKRQVEGLERLTERNILKIRVSATGKISSLPDRKIDLPGNFDFRSIALRWPGDPSDVA